MNALLIRESTLGPVAYGSGGNYLNTKKNSERNFHHARRLGEGPELKNHRRLFRRIVRLMPILAGSDFPVALQDKQVIARKPGTVDCAFQHNRPELEHNYKMLPDNSVIHSFFNYNSVL